MLNYENNEFNNNNDRNIQKYNINPKNNSDNSLNTNFTNKYSVDVNLSKAKINTHIYAGTPISQESYNTLIKMLNPNNMKSYIIYTANEMSRIEYCGIKVVPYMQFIAKFDEYSKNLIQSKLTEDETNECIEFFLEKLDAAFKDLNAHIETIINDNDKLEYLNKMIKRTIYLQYGEDGVKNYNDDEFINILKADFDKFKFMSSFFISNSKEEFHSEIDGIVSTISNNQNKQCIYPNNENSKYYTTLSPKLIYALISKIDNLKSRFLSELDAVCIKDANVISDAINDFEGSVLSEALTKDRINIYQDKHDIILEFPYFPSLTNQIDKHQDNLTQKLLPFKKLLNELGGDLKINVDTDDCVINAIISCPKQDEMYVPMSELCSNETFYSQLKGRVPIVPTLSATKFKVPYTSLSDNTQKLDETNSYEIILDKNCMQSETNRQGVIKLLSNINSLNSNDSLSHVAVTNLSESPIVVLKYDSDAINEKSDNHHMSFTNTNEFIYGNFYKDKKFCGDDAACVYNLPIFADDKLLNEVLLMHQFNCNKILMNIDENCIVNLYNEFFELNRILSMLDSNECKCIDFTKIDNKPSEIVITNTKKQLLFSGVYIQALKKYFGRFQTDLESYDKVLNVFDSFAKSYLQSHEDASIKSDPNKFIAELSNMFENHNIKLADKYKENLYNFILELPVNNLQVNNLPVNINGFIFEVINEGLRFKNTTINKENDVILIDIIDSSDIDELVKHVVK